MQTGYLLEIFLPVSLFIIMLGMGLSLTSKDFSRIALYPKAMILGIIGQLLLLPMIGFGVATLFRLEPNLAVGLMILSFCPSGSTSNMYSYIFRGDVALSISLTALISIIKPFTLPILAYYAMLHFLGEGKTIELPILKTIIQLFVITVLPVGIGMLVRHFQPMISKIAEKPIKIFSMVILFVIVAGVIHQNWDKMYGFFLESGMASFTLNIISLSLGLGISLLAKLDKAQTITLAFELGIQNGTTALLVTGTILKNSEMTIVPVTYSLLMFLNALIFGSMLLSKKEKRSI
ncbi:bile acid:sodium symporter family protein [Leptospira sp. GIMC2001]|uniref:bile acid:sodium symporter family protein n=1 Tax=Leptospira sp. GIMC2001 TaxID=1513297 RepID=UPI00234A658E|nr:bile acid:sodium symporter family protein [Leptospira sp. GIMC2001]WCL50176.1 bile acid:sodium symporter family protein [Leptospira sp. GIMC2001]